VQLTGYVLIQNKKHKVLIRQGRSFNLSRHLKLRKTGKDGVFMQDESEYLKSRPDFIELLKSGKVIEC